MRTVLWTLLAIALALPGMLWAQAPPNLSGTWTFDAAKSDPEPAPAGRAGAGRGAAANSPLTITQMGGDVTVRQGTITMPLKADGTETFYFQQGEVRAT